MASEKEKDDRKYRVLHGAVSGVMPDRKGVVKERDFYTGSIVTANQLEGDENVLYYLSQGAIEEVEKPS